MESEKINLKQIITAVRPSRYAVFINEENPDWQENCERVIEWYSQMWGGAHNFIIPTNGDSIDNVFWQLLEIFQPDHCNYYIRTLKDVFLEDSDEYEKMCKKRTNDVLNSNRNYSKKQAEEMVRSSMVISSAQIDKFEISDSLQDEIIFKLNPFHTGGSLSMGYIRAEEGASYQDISVQTICEEFKEDHFISNYDLNSFSKNMQLWVHSIIGNPCSLEKNNYKKTTIDFRARPKNIKFSTKNLDFNDISSLFIEFNNINNIRSDNTSFGLSLYNLEKFTKTKLEDPKKQPVTIIIGDSIKDFCLYYNLSKLMDGVYWISPAVTNKEQEEDVNLYLTYLLDEIERQIYGSGYIKEIKIILTSLSLKKEELKTFEKKLNDIKKTAKPQEDFNLTIQIPYKIKENVKNPCFILENENYNNSYLEQFLDNISLNELKTPKPKGFKKLDVFKHKWITDVDISKDVRESDKRNGYLLPSKPYFSKDIFLSRRVNYFDASNVRFTREKISFYCPTQGLIRSSDNMDNIITKPQLKLLTNFEIFERIFNEAGYYIKLSDKGEYAKNSINIFGSLQNIASELRDDKIKQIFQCFCDFTIAKARKENGIKGSIVNKRVYLNFNDIVSFLDNEKIARKKINFYLYKNIFERGYVLKCEKCKNADWYRMEEIGQKFICHRCQKKQVYTENHWRETAEPIIYYKLNEMFFQGYSHNMLVTILTLDKLRRQTKESFFYLPEVEIRKNKNDEKPLIEMDICSISDGKILFGEAKKNAEIPEKIELYKTIVNKINAYFVLSTFADKWSEDKKKKVMAMEWRNKPVIFEKSNIIKR